MGRRKVIARFTLIDNGFKVEKVGYFTQGRLAPAFTSRVPRVPSDMFARQLLARADAV